MSVHVHVVKIYTAVTDFDLDYNVISLDMDSEKTPNWMD